jgi:hypothetical protein
LVELAEIQAIYYMVAATGVLIAAAYYVMNLRITQKNQEQTLETRQINAYLTLTNSVKMNMEDMTDVLYVYKWDDYDDFIEKYSPQKNPKAFSKIWKQLDFWNELGMLIKKEFIPMDFIYEQWSGGVIESWEKLHPLILVWRAAGETNLGDSFEYLYHETKKRMPNYTLFDKQIENVKLAQQKKGQLR